MISKNWDIGDSFEQESFQSGKEIKDHFECMKCKGMWSVSGCLGDGESGMQVITGSTRRSGIGHTGLYSVASGLFDIVLAIDHGQNSGPDTSAAIVTSLSTLNQERILGRTMGG
jgi:hypothetical protein